MKGIRTSDKPVVIEYLFDKHWDAAANALIKNVMTLDDVVEAIRACNAIDGLTRSPRNPANFLKDIVRSRNASKIWPGKIATLRYTGEQRTGAGDSFAFVPFEPDQAEPFPDLFRPDNASVRSKLESVSIPLAAKALGRSDEAWLIQTAVKLRVVEQHMATASNLDVQEITHLQMNVKLRATEIDAIYLATMLMATQSTVRKGAAKKPREARKALITCEAKKHSERILIGQITSQAQAAFEMTDVDVVIPIAIRSVRHEGIQLIEFEAIERSQASQITRVSYVRDVIYRLEPAVKGI